MKKVSILLASLLFLSISVHAQLVAICGFNSETPDGFSFVALTNLTAGTVIYFTDGPYVSSSNSFNTSSSSDGVMSYTVPAGGLTEGTLIRAVESSSNNFTLTRSGGGSTGAMSVLSGSFNLDNGGEVIWAFSSSNATTPAANVTEIFSGIVFGGGSPGSNPTSDANAPLSANFTYLNFTNNRQDGGYYSGSLTNTTLAQFTNTANWTTSTNNITLSTSAFTTPSFGGSVFPVEFVSFEAAAGVRSIELSWVTATELNNDFFAVERSMDSENFTEIGRVAGAGNTNEMRSYQFSDANPASDKMYYRLRQVDFDGATSFSTIVEVTMDAAPAAVKSTLTR